MKSPCAGSRVSPRRRSHRPSHAIRVELSESPSHPCCADSDLPFRGPPAQPAGGPLPLTRSRLAQPVTPSQRPPWHWHPVTAGPRRFQVPGTPSTDPSHQTPEGPARQDGALRAIRVVGSAATRMARRPPARDLRSESSAEEEEEVVVVAAAAAYPWRGC